MIPDKDLKREVFMLRFEEDDDYREDLITTYHHDLMGAYPGDNHAGASEHYCEIYLERCYQLAKWGNEIHDPYKFIAILVEEVGEAAKAILEGYPHDYRSELYQVAAVAVRAIQAINSSLVPLEAIPAKASSEEELAALFSSEDEIPF